MLSKTASIDFGTTRSGAGVFESKKKTVTFIKNEMGNTLFHSVLVIDPESDAIFVGESAKQKINTL